MLKKIQFLQEQWALQRRELRAAPPAKISPTTEPPSLNQAQGLSGSPRPWGHRLSPRLTYIGEGESRTLSGGAGGVGVGLCVAAPPAHSGLGGGLTGRALVPRQLHHEL